MSHKTDFEKLQKVWYSKLKESGFTDIEKKNGSVGRGAPRVDNINDTQKQAIEDYYSMARSFLEEHTFRTELDKTIWEYYSEGITVRDINKLLAKVNIRKPKSTVWDIIKRLEKIMYAKYQIGKHG